MEDDSQDVARFRSALLPYCESVGMIASGWSHIEQILDEILWRLAGVKRDHGACFTAQFLSVKNRFDALLALLKLRNFEQAFLDRVEALAKTSATLASQRNRIVHDPLSANQNFEVIRHVVLSQKKLTRTKQAANIQDYKNVTNKIFDFLGEISRLDRDVSAFLRASRKKSS